MFRVSVNLAVLMSDRDGLRHCENVERRRGAGREGCRITRDELCKIFADKNMERQTAKRQREGRAEMI